MNISTLEALDTNIGAMLKRGHGQTNGFLGRQALTDIRAESDSLRWWRRDQENRGTGHHRVFKPEPHTMAERVLYRSRPIPRILEVGLEIQEAVQEVGRHRSIPLLRSWTMNHVIVNKMTPKHGPEAVHIHTDPKYYSGLLAVISLDPATLKIGEFATRIPTEEGTLETFIGADLAELTEGEQGTTQELHAVDVDQDRYSVIYANDTRLPQTFGQILHTQLQNR